MLRYKYQGGSPKAAVWIGATPLLAQIWELTATLHGHTKGCKTELQELLQLQITDVVAIQETTLRPTEDIRVLEYQLHRKDKEIQGEVAHGATAFFVKNNIQHVQISLLQTEIMEAIAVEVITARGKLEIASCYRVLTQGLLQNGLEEVLFLKQREQHIEIGDFNVKSRHWHSKITNRNSKELEAFLEKREDVHVMVTEEPIHQATVVTNNVLDIILARNVVIELEMKVLQKGSSDHAPIEVLLGNGPTAEDSTEFTKTNWGLFRITLRRDLFVINRIENVMEIEENMWTLKSDIKTALNASSKITRKSSIRKYMAKILEKTKRFSSGKIINQKRAFRSNGLTDENALNKLNRRVKAAPLEAREKQWQEGGKPSKGTWSDVRATGLCGIRPRLGCLSTKILLSSP
ncbi:uncharacterized protein [Euwallacea fornicatus]|uniref:uncharacterized protein n=1 Tax=Euwallacea fornicatus TaxID=995702 RepID=UPI00338E1B05